ncbi:hypothetical protein [Porphyrobacter sp. YT40]|uniref:hypothetical protein n=1 Tax=Porphyrobacter sp. YT40 TaxID=2547601 RepID=UPI0011446772|nr:hypothetical protein [Porphyrobacter sp. YT40]QDH34412.1 hypothetical protein E2E27_08825 [Porphyrobacter sp. YT40]
MKRRLPLVLAALAATIAAPVSAQPSAPVAEAPAGPIDFTVHGDAFAVTAPAGYCTPTGARATQMDTANSWDSQNLTPVSLIRCGTEGEDYILVKTPRLDESIDLSRADFLGVMKDQFTAELIEQGLATGSRDLSKGSGIEVKIGGDSFGYRGADERCVYLGGSLEAAGADGRKVAGQVGVCITLVRGRLLTVNAYDFGPGADAAAMMARAREMAATIT